MAWVNTPWMIGGGVEHSVELARFLAYAAFGGKEGVSGPDDLKVTPLNVPGTGVLIAKGACAIRNRGVDYESYAAMCPTGDTVTIPATGSGATRSDMVIAHVKDPWHPGTPWTDPSEAAKQAYPYVVTTVLSNVPNTARTLADAGYSSYSAIPLARIDLPVSTGTVTAARIIDLRGLYNPQSENISKIIKPTADRTLTGGGSWVDWPSPEFVVPVTVPPWATHVNVRAILGGVRYGASGSNGGAGWSVNGELRVAVGSAQGDPSGYSVDSDAGVDTMTLMAGASMLNVKALRGTSVNLKVQGKKDNGTTSLLMNTKSVGSLEATWVEAVT